MLKLIPEFIYVQNAITCLLLATTDRKYNIMYLLVSIINKKHFDVNVKATPILPQGNTTKPMLFSSRFNEVEYVH